MSQSITVQMIVSVETDDQPWAPGMSQQFGMRTRVYEFDVFEASSELIRRPEGTTMSLNAIHMKHLWDDWCRRLAKAGVEWMGRTYDALESSGPPPSPQPESDWEV